MTYTTILKSLNHRNYVNNLSGGSFIARNRVRIQTEVKLLLTVQYHANYIEKLVRRIVF